MLSQAGTKRLCQLLSSDQIDDHELFFKISSIHCQQDTIQQDLTTPTRLAIHDANIPDQRQIKLKKKKKQITERGNIDDMKKVMHREIEKQRRQEMTALLAFMRSLLPYEYIKGRRSMSDQVNQAVSYIKDKQNRVKELTDKRDELKIIESVHFPETFKKCYSISLVVQPFGDQGIEMIYQTKIDRDEQDIPLSKLLELLVKEGLDIISCVSTKVQNSLLHTIYSQTSDSAELDLPNLEQRINRAISLH